jgi:hypothetical protein
MSTVVALSASAAGKYEAQAFTERHLEAFVACQYNSGVMMKYIEDHKLPPNVDSFEKAFVALSKQFKLWPAPAIMAAMSAEQIHKLQEEIGIPRYDFRGKITGYDWPDGVTNLIASSEREWSRQRTVSDCRPTNPKLVGHKPTNKELAIWTSEQMRAWQDANDQ